MIIDKHFYIKEYGPYDKYANNSYRVIIKSYKSILFGLIKWTSKVVINNYYIDNTYGDLGHMPFFDIESAQNRLNILKSNYERSKK